jgi:hypothetical protein
MIGSYNNIIFKLSLFILEYKEVKDILKNKLSFDPSWKYGCFNGL